MTTYKPIHRLALAADAYMESAFGNPYVRNSKGERIRLPAQDGVLLPQDVATVLGWLIEAKCNVSIWPDGKKFEVTIETEFNEDAGDRHGDSFIECGDTLEAALYSAVAKLFPKEKT